MPWLRGNLIHKGAAYTNASPGTHNAQMYKLSVTQLAQYLESPVHSEARAEDW